MASSVTGAFNTDMIKGRSLYLLPSYIDHTPYNMICTYHGVRSSAGAAATGLDTVEVIQKNRHKVMVEELVALGVRD